MASGDPYAGADLGFSVKLSQAFWACGLLIFCVLMPFYPPTRAIGTGGWVIVGGSIPVTIAMVIHLRRHPEKMTMQRLLVQSYVSVAEIGLVEWMAGGGHAPYTGLLGFSLFGTALGQPLRRAIPFAAYVTAVSFLPLLYASDGFPAGMVATSTAVSLGICTFVALTMSHTRDQRARLAMEGEAARSDALTDGLTGLGNRRAFDLELDQAVEAGVGLVVLLDVDDFKSINDSFGHQVGDECLVACGAALRESVRTPDACYRWGGDEFAVLICDGSHTGAEEAIFERIQRRLEASFQLPDGSTPRLTFGASEFDDAAARAHGLLVAADMRLLERKRARKAKRVRGGVAASLR
jgi:diguanylate cyclase (GGDEF)-like protein